MDVIKFGMQQKYLPVRACRIFPFGPPKDGAPWIANAAVDREDVVCFVKTLLHLRFHICDFPGEYSDAPFWWVL